MQLAFRIAGSLLLAATILVVDWALGNVVPEDRPFDRPLIMDVRLTNATVRDVQPEGWQIGGVWQLDGGGTPATGLSGLAFDGDDLLAVSDRGYLLRFAPPTVGQRTLAIASRPVVPNPSLYDAESITVLRDAIFVAFETDPQLVWQLDDFIESRTMPGFGADNRGAEAMAALGEKVVILGEQGFYAAALVEDELIDLELSGGRAAPTGAAALRRDDELLVLQRGFGVRGFEAYISTARLDGGDVRIGPARELGLRWRDNAEGIAIRPRAGGGHEVWVVTDDNGRAPQRTILVRYDVAAGTWPFDERQPEG